MVNMAGGGILNKLGAGTLVVGGQQIYGVGSSLRVAGGTVVMNSNPGTPFSSAGSRLALSISGSTFRLGSDADFDELDAGYTGAGIQTFDLNSPPAPGAFHAVRIYAANLALAKSALYGAIRNANATGGNFPDGIVDLGLHGGSGIGLATVADYILIRPTKVGDLNLDGSVTIADFIALASHFNQAGTWEE